MFTSTYELARLGGWVNSYFGCYWCSPMGVSISLIEIRMVLGMKQLATAAKNQIKYSVSQGPTTSRKENDSVRSVFVILDQSLQSCMH